MNDIVAKIEGRLVIDHHGCWVWQGAKSSEGYGRVRIPGGGLAYTHRAMFESAKGPVPDGRQIDHLCRNRACCNPDHLEAVTPLVNVHRSTAAEVNKRMREQRTHCRRGHLLDAENSYFYANGYRSCRECRRVHHMIENEKRRENKGFHRAFFRTDTGEAGSVVPIKRAKNA